MITGDPSMTDASGWALESQRAPTIARALRGLLSAHQDLLVERYERLLPVLLLLMRPSDILERNRAWPGVSPSGKGASQFLAAKAARQARNQIDAYTAAHDVDATSLWQLFYAYCRYGPIGLLEALPSHLQSLIPDELQDCADFHRLAKHPRSDAGRYVRELLDEYARALNYPCLPPFLARYAFASNRRIERWYVGEHAGTDYIPKTTRRLNRHQPYPHQCWRIQVAPLPLECLLAQRHRTVVRPWLCWAYDTHTTTLMGFTLCPYPPASADVLLCLRWSIWHYDAPWWKARGAPDQLLVPRDLLPQTRDARTALRFIRCRVAESDPPEDTVWTSFPANFEQWLLAHQSGQSSRSELTMAELRQRMLIYIRDHASHSVAASTPLDLAARDVSLPWASGVAAAHMLPSAGVHVVRDRTVQPFGVPFDGGNTLLPEGQAVDIRYDPADARAVYLLSEDAHVVRAVASAFEHRIPWYELMPDPAMLQYSFAVHDSH